MGFFKELFNQANKAAEVNTELRVRAKAMKEPFAAKEDWPEINKIMNDYAVTPNEASYVIRMRKEGLVDFLEDHYGHLKFNK